MDVGLVTISALVALLTAFLLRTRIPATIVVTVLVVAGAGLGWGAMLLQDDPSIGEVVAAVAILAVLVPAHVRIVVGPLGRR